MGCLPLPSAIFPIALLLLSGRSADAFSASRKSASLTSGLSKSPIAASSPIDNGRRSLHSTILFAEIEPGASPAELTELEAAQARETPTLEPDDRSFVSSLYAACDGISSKMEDEIAGNLDNMHPRLVVALQLAADAREWKSEGDGAEFEAQMVALGDALATVLNTRLKSGREMLAALLDCGEIRRLDSAIGKAAGDGRLDMSFFSVLSMNMRDAAAADGGGGGAPPAAPTLARGEGQDEVEGDGGRPRAGADRSQILQHIHTRCQEELEKNVDPGMGLLNKLLRTEVSSIRSNQLGHYLGPQATTITSPDGRVIELAGSTAEPLVSHTEFTTALESAVNRIRTLESAGGTDRLSAMNLVENIRQVAMEARVVMVDAFGEGSEVVGEFQRDLQPVFRPGSKVP